MQNATRKRRWAKVISLMLALALVITLLPATSLVAEAATESITITNSKGEETDTFYVGEPINVAAISSDPSAWVGIYNKGGVDGSGYWYWYYVSQDGHTAGEPVNLYDTSQPWKAGELLPAGSYDVALHYNGTTIIKEITIVAPASTESSLEVENETVSFGEPIRIKTYAYGSQDWIAVYAGKMSAADTFGSNYSTWYYTAGHNGEYVDLTLAVGEYTICLLKNDSYTLDKLINVTVKEPEAEVTLLSTDKTEYKYGEPIMVTANWSGTSAWVGLYKKGDTFNPETGGVVSIFWYYISGQNNPVDITKTDNSGGRIDEFVAGDYTVVLFSDGGYNDIATVDITITKEEVSRVTTDATCVAEGSTVITYSDGTTDTITSPKLEHDWGKYVYDGATAKTHTRVCAYDSERNHVETANCNFDEGVVTKEATLTENGIMTFTCQTCSGTYTTEISKKEVVRTEVLKEATCEEEGTLRTHYNDNSYIDTPIQKKDHTYGKWVFDLATKTHSKTCGTDTEKTHVLTEDCSFVSNGIVNEKQQYICTTCEGTYEVALIATDKTTYEAGEPIMVNTHYMSDGAWVGIYKKGETYNPSVGGAFSIYWYYLTEESNPVDITKTRDENGRSGEFKGGDYTVVLFGSDDYNNIASVDITIEKDEDEDDPIVPPTGSLTTDKTTYAIGESVMVTANCANKGSWVGLYKKGEKYNPNAGGVVSFYWYYVVDSGIDRNGKEINLMSTEFRNTDRPDAMTEGEYTLVLFGDSGYSNVLATVDLTFEGSVTGDTTYDLQLNGTSYETDGFAEFNEDDEINMLVTADGKTGTSWVGLYDKKLSADVDFGSVGTSIYWAWISDINGKAVNLHKEATLAAGEYTLAIFGDSGFADVKKVMNFSIVQESTGDKVIKEPTCENYGTKYVEYEDGTTAYLPIDPLGHDYTNTELVFDKDLKVHTATCGRCKETITSTCQFGDGVIIKTATENQPGEIQYTCTECGGKYTESYELDVPKDTTVQRIYGDTRIETSLKVADELKASLGIDKFETILVASGTSYADALSGSYLANLKNAPILMVNEKSIGKVQEYIKENLNTGGTVYILGGTAAVPAAMDGGLDGFNVKRLAGETRYETNIEILKAAQVSGQDLLICTGLDFADSLSASAVNLPILLVGKELSDAQVSYLKTLSTETFYIIGGENAVSSQTESYIRSYLGATHRIGGATRYQTSVQVAETFMPDASTAVLAYGKNYPDGVCGGALAGALGCPVILTEDKAAAITAAYAAEKGIQAGAVLGGAGLISDASVRVIYNMAQDAEIQIAGQIEGEVK